MIQVNCKDDNGYNLVYGKFYNDYKNAQVHDIVVVDGRKGYQIGEVTEINCINDSVNIETLPDIVAVVEREEQRRERIKKKFEMQKTREKIKRKMIEEKISKLNLDADELLYINSLNDKEVMKLFNELNQ